MLEVAKAKGVGQRKIPSKKHNKFVFTSLYIQLKSQV